jgi:hypothetical protein
MRLGKQHTELGTADNASAVLHFRRNYLARRYIVSVF